MIKLLKGFKHKKKH